MTTRHGVCGWCGAAFKRSTPGRVGQYCSAAHRQAAYRARQSAPRAGERDPALNTALASLQLTLSAPGEYSALATWLAAHQVLSAAGLTVDEAPPAPASPPAGIDRTRYARAQAWTGAPLPRPAKVNPRWYERSWDDDHGWVIRVRPLRAGQPFTVGKALWQRQHRHDPRAGHRYDWTDRWGVLQSDNLRALGGALIGDALDLPAARGELGGSLARRSQLPLIAAHFAGDVLHPLGDQPWRLTTAEIVDWTDLHNYLTPLVR